MNMASKMNVFTKIVRPDLLGTALLGKNMTFAVKANIGCGFPAPSSTPSLRDWVPKDFSPVIQLLVDSGHQIVGIGSNCPGISGTVPDYKNLSRVPERYVKCPGRVLT